MRKIKLASFLVLSLTLSVALPALVMGQAAPGGGGKPGGKPTPVPTSTPTPVIGDDDGDEDLEGCFGVLDFFCNRGERHHHDYSRFGDRGERR
jgi:hypothetical protein